MSKAGDLSYARPGSAALKRAGFTDVLRYFSYDTGKNLSHDELVDYLSHGFGVGVVWESTATRGLSGAAGGLADGEETLQQARTTGYTGKIYAAYDFDATDAQKPVIAAYQAAFNKATDGRGRAGYGSYYVIKYLFDHDLIDYGWQTLAWSGGLIDPRAQLYQNGVTAFGGGVDIDEVRKADYGQMKHGATATPKVKPVKRVTPTVSHVPNGQTYIVVKGDTLGDIGARFHIKYQIIAAVNGIADPDKIYPGQVLRIPGTNVPTAAPSSRVIYVVKRGDTLSEIAAKYHTTYQHLAQINGIANPNLISVGQHIRIS